MNSKEGWESNEAVKHYKRIVNILVPGRNEILSIISNLVRDFTKEPRILEVGCGFGDITAHILDTNPNSKAFMMDYSEEMLDLCRERFKDNINIKIARQDLNMGLPKFDLNEKFDVIVSSIALHHIEFENRVKLYSGIRSALNENGLFINADLFKGENSKFDKWEFNNWISWMVKQIKENMGIEKDFEEVKRTQIESNEKLGDKPGTIWDMREDLLKAGFNDVDCVWKYQNLAVMVGFK